ncbi:hypothetical protein EBF04_27270 [Streptomyces sp. I6]|nr:hypothetical protein EBF04_27270 [Streptomyces sp. I6]
MRSIPAWYRPCWRWSSPTGGVIRSRRCDGRRSRHGSRPASRPPGDSGWGRHGCGPAEGRGSSPQGTGRTTEGARRPDRDAQFHYINDQVQEFTGAGEPLISLDARMRELLGGLRGHGAGAEVDTVQQRGGGRGLVALVGARRRARISVVRHRGHHWRRSCTASLPQTGT